MIHAEIQLEINGAVIEHTLKTTLAARPIKGSEIWLDDIDKNALPLDVILSLNDIFNIEAREGYIEYEDFQGAHGFDELADTASEFLKTHVLTVDFVHISTKRLYIRCSFYDYNKRTK